MSEGGRAAVKANDQVFSKAEASAMKKRINELERLLSRKSMESKFSKKRKLGSFFGRGKY